jgi:type III secretion protein R
MIKQMAHRVRTYKLNHSTKAAIFFGSLCLTFAIVLLLPGIAMAANEETNSYLNQISKLDGGGISNKPMLLMIALIGVTLLPFVGMMVTSFVKIAVVLSITRQAISVQQAPPNTVITGLAILLTVYVMHPVGIAIYERTEKFFDHQNSEFFDKTNVDVIFKVVAQAEEPLKQFLTKNASSKNIQMFHQLGRQMRAQEKTNTLLRTDFLVLIPAFVITELTRAFQIGFIIFLPFMVVDMAISNILMALGMQMLSPTTISLPFKILLFVMVDGWYLITKGLVLGYQV